MTGFGVAASLQELVALRNQAPAPLFPSGRRGPVALPGLHSGPHRSRGMEFSESRPYLPGDDVRAVDWRQTARRGRLYTKLFQEEHERPVAVFADLGPNMRFGTRGAFKSVVAARAAAWLAWRVVGGGDRIGGLVWDGERESEIRPLGRDPGALQFLKRLAEVSAAPAASSAGEFAKPLASLARTLRPGSRVVLISDFAGLDAESEGRIRALAKGAELALIHVYDRFEAEAPAPGCYPVTDGRHSRVLDLRSEAARIAHVAPFAACRAALESLARRAGASLLSLATDADLGVELARAFGRRQS